MIQAGITSRIFVRANSTTSYTGPTSLAGGSTVTFNGTDNSTGVTTLGSTTLLMNATGSTGAVNVTGTSATTAAGVVGGTDSLGGAVTLGTVAATNATNAFSSITGGTKGTASSGTPAAVTSSGAIGMLTLGSLTMNAGSIYQVDLSNTATDVLKISGSLLSNGATISFVQDVTSGTLASGTYVIATFASDTGSTYTETGIPTGFQVVDTGTALELEPMSAVPEPATFVLPSLLSGWLLLVLARRQKGQAC